ncbi:MAG: 50S ribosomal protein L4 [Clostridiales bacterium]|jgi:large subunit ribosomal protein L4|nr:50S ribosomal protein L4 [Clostridiales bacterium]
MATVNVYDKSGKQIGNIDLDDSIFNIDVNEHAVHMAVTAYLANQRQGTKGTKTRAEVRGGGAKPWRQKGTGRARQGSRRAPQWTGGGVVFAPKARDYSMKINKKIKRLALKSVLTQKVQGEKFIVVEDLNLDEIKTKKMQAIVNSFSIKNALIVMENGNVNAMKSARNIPNVKTAGVNTINVYDILKYDSFIVTREAVSAMQEVYA